MATKRTTKKAPAKAGANPKKSRLELTTVAPTALQRDALIDTLSLLKNGSDSYFKSLSGSVQVQKNLTISNNYMHGWLFDNQDNIRGILTGDIQAPKPMLIEIISKLAAGYNFALNLENYNHYCLLNLQPKTRKSDIPPPLIDALLKSFSKNRGKSAAAARWLKDPTQSFKRKAYKEWQRWQEDRGIYKYPRDYRRAMLSLYPEAIDGTLKNWMSEWTREKK